MKRGFRMRLHLCGISLRWGPCDRPDYALKLRRLYGTVSAGRPGLLMTDFWRHAASSILFQRRSIGRESTFTMGEKLRMFWAR